MEKLKLYKVLRGLTSPFQNFKYEFDKAYYCSDIETSQWISSSRGLYAVDLDGLIYSWRRGYRVYECEVWGRRVEYNRFKRRYEYLRLVRYVPYSELRRLAKSYEDRVGYKLEEALFPINPFKIKAPRIQEKHIQLLKDWVSVRDSSRALVRDLVWASISASVGDSIGALVSTSVRASVGQSVWTSVWASVSASVRASMGGASAWPSIWDSVSASIRTSIGASVKASVGDSVGAYISSLFPKIKKWEYIQYEKGKNPFQSCIDLWRAGLVPSFDGEVWRLHAGRDAKVVYELD